MKAFAIHLCEHALTTVTQLRNFALGAEIDEELYLHMTNPDGRKALGAALLQSCFSEAGQKALREQSGIHGEAFQYSLVLESAAHTQKAGEAIFPEKYKAAARNQGFRRSIVSHYDHRCAFCRTRIVTSEGHTAVDAAHIVPWSISKNDDIRNGMALCKLCHWGFDEGLMGVSDNYAVIVSKQVAQKHNSADAVLDCANKKMHGPDDKELWPYRPYLASHRDRHREKFRA